MAADDASILYVSYQTVATGFLVQDSGMGTQE
jgi:hypothetical protein